MRRGPGIAGLKQHVKARVRRYSAVRWKETNLELVMVYALNAGVPLSSLLQFYSSLLMRMLWTMQEQYKAVGEEVKAASLQAMKEQMSKFKASLEDFARKHKDDIRKDPVFRAQFHQMCANIGVDPLVSSKVSHLAAVTPLVAWAG